MVALIGFSHAKNVYRAFGTSNLRFVRFQQPSTGKLVDVGCFQPKSDKQYSSGQLFLHKAFAYRGIILCSFNSKVFNKPKPNEAFGIQNVTPYYQVLIHKDDWEFMSFSYDLTSYLGQGSNREEKVLNVIHGMDCVAHSEVLPYCVNEETSNKKPPIDHNLFYRFFEANDEENCPKYKIRQDNISLHTNQSFWLIPQAVHKEITENVEVQVITYYLGTNLSKGQVMHCWRYVTRIQNLDKQKIITIRNRMLKVFSLNNLSHVAGNGISGFQSSLTPQQPVCQFSSHIHLQQGRGAYMWGKIRMDREDGESFEVNIPTVPLDSISETALEKVENSLL